MQRRCHVGILAEKKMDKAIYLTQMTDGFLPKMTWWVGYNPSNLLDMLMVLGPYVSHATTDNVKRIRGEV
jgi:hypothetical protein